MIDKLEASLSSARIVLLWIVCMWGRDESREDSGLSLLSVFFVPCQFQITTVNKYLPVKSIVWQFGNSQVIF